MARIAIGGFQHETNSFVPHRADFAYFASHRDRPPLVRGAELIDWLTGSSFAMAGFLAEMRDGHALVPLVWASGGAGGTVTADAFERIVGEMLGRLSEAMPVDAVYLDLHGAMASEPFEDAEGEILRRVRSVVGEAVPIMVSLDYHANMTPQMVECADGIVAFKTYPHVDRPETGTRAARVMTTLLQRGRPPGRALRNLPFLIPAECQCTLVEPSRGIVARTGELAGELVDLAYLAGFPASDLHWCGPSVVAHAWSQKAADRAADALADWILALESAFVVEAFPPRDAVERAMAIAAGASRPVLIADTQDNPGAGSSADTTGLLVALVEAGATGAMVGYLCDPLAAAAAHEAGEGSELTIGLGGRSGPAGVAPFEARFRVARLGDGRFRTTGKVNGDLDVDLGPMALLTVDGVGIAVTTKRMQAFDPAPFHHLGVDPARQRILVLKSTCHFRADFEPLAEAVIIGLAPGGFSADPARYPFRRLRPGIRLRPLGPIHPAGER